MAYSLHDLKVIGMETAEILSCRIEGKTGEHTSLSLRTYVENEETIVYEMLYCQPLRKFFFAEWYPMSRYIIWRMSVFWKSRERAPAG